MSLAVMKEAISPDFSINIASSFCKESGSDYLGLYFVLVLEEESVFVGTVAEFDCFDLEVTIIMNDAEFGCTVLTSFIAVTSGFFDIIPRVIRYFLFSLFLILSEQRRKLNHK